MSAYAFHVQADKLFSITRNTSQTAGGNVLLF